MHDIFIILDDTKSYTNDDSNQFMETNQSKILKNKVKNTTHSKKYKKSDFEVRSNYSKTNKIDSSVSVQFSSASLQSTNSRVRIQSNSRLDNDKKYFQTDSGKNYPSINILKKSSNSTIKLKIYTLF